MTKKKKKKKILPFGPNVDPNIVFMRKHLKIMLGDKAEMFERSVIAE
jgi:hypothetical protein